MGRTSPTSTRSVLRRRKRILVLKKGMSKKSSWSKCCTKDRKGLWSEDHGTDEDSPMSIGILATHGGKDEGPSSSSDSELRGTSNLAQQLERKPREGKRPSCNFGGPQRVHR